jgi:hypothetical protein
MKDEVRHFPTCHWQRGHLSLKSKVAKECIKLGQPDQRQRVSHKPVFIIGCGRSGTTLLFEILKSHPDLAPTKGHPDGEDHVGWTQHGNAVIGGIYGNPTLDDHGSVVGCSCCLHMTADDATEQIKESMHRYYYDAVQQGQARLRVLNKCPHLCNKIGFVQAIFPDAVFVHIIREPVAMAASWVSIMRLVPNVCLYWPNVDFPCWWVLPRVGAMQSNNLMERQRQFFPGGGTSLLGEYWATINEDIRRQCKLTGARMITVRYEDLVSKPKETIADICRFSGLKEMRLPPITIDVERNGMRKSLLSQEEEQEIARKTAVVGASFGY